MCNGVDDDDVNAPYIFANTQNNMQYTSDFILIENFVQNYSFASNKIEQ